MPFALGRAGASLRPHSSALRVFSCGPIAQDSRQRVEVTPRSPGVDPAPPFLCLLRFSLAFFLIFSGYFHLNSKYKTARDTYLGQGHSGKTRDTGKHRVTQFNSKTPILRVF